ncbi:MAG: GNAT family N-acetyltransferase [Pseudomonadota bacterium]
MSIAPRILRTKRLVVREAETQDAPFLLQLMNDPDWHRFIGDRGVRDVAAAGDYIEQRVRAAYATDGMGMRVVTIDNKPIGLCGINQRDYLDDADIGFAFLPEYRRAGYAFEACAEILTLAKDVVGLKQLIAITLPSNKASHGLLEKLGFVFRRILPPDADGDELALFQRAL